MSRIGRLFIIVGPSGAGKGTLVKALMTRVPSLCLSISATTRKPRNGEVDGEDYYFLNVDDFKYKIDNRSFLEWANIYGEYYGTLKDNVEAVLKLGSDVILEIDIQGARQIKELDIEYADFIFIKPPSIEELRRRLVNRGTDSDEAIEKRLAVAREEISAMDGFNHIVENDDLNQAIDNLCDIIVKCRESK